MPTYASKLSWLGNLGKATALDITTWTGLTVRRGLDSKSNSFDLTVKNQRTERSSNNQDIHEWTTDTNELLIQQDDKIKIYLKKQTTGDDAIDVSGDSTDLLMIGDVIEFGTVFDERRTQLKISGIDKTFNLLSNLWAEAFTTTDALTSPKIVQSVIRSISDGITGEGFDDDGNVVNPGKYAIDARLFSESVVDSGTTTSAATKKLIQTGQNFLTTVEVGDSVRNTTGTTDNYATVTAVDSDTQLSISKDIMGSGDTYQVSNGFIQDSRITESDGDHDFPATTLTKIWKPAYEWIEDLSAIRATNTTAEIDSTPIQNRKMVYYVDDRNRFHWFYPDDEQDYDVETGVDSIDDGTILGIKMVKKTFDAVNMIIFNSGRDLANIGILNYFFDESTELRGLKMKYIPMTQIASDLREDEADKGGITINEDQTVTLTGSYDYTTSWGEVVSSDDEYKTAFREQCIKLGKQASQKITNKKSRPRWAKSISLDYINYTPGELLSITSRQYGMSNVLVRIQDVTHSVTRNGIFTDITVEEDEPKVGETV